MAADINDIEWAGLARYLAGEGDPVEMERWISASPGRSAWVGHLRQAFEAHQQALHQWEGEPELARLMARIRAYENPGERTAGIPEDFVDPLRTGKQPDRMAGRQTIIQSARNFFDELTTRAVTLVEGKDTKLEPTVLQQLRDFIKRTDPEKK